MQCGKKKSDRSRTTTLHPRNKTWRIQMSHPDLRCLADGLVLVRKNDERAEAEHGLLAAKWEKRKIFRNRLQEKPKVQPFQCFHRNNTLCEKKNSLLRDLANGVGQREGVGVDVSRSPSPERHHVVQASMHHRIAGWPKARRTSYTRSPSTIRPACLLSLLPLTPPLEAVCPRGRRFPRCSRRDPHPASFAGVRRNV